MEMEKHYDYQKCEPTLRDLWEKEKVYAFVPDNRTVFSIDTPPPTVSGTLHIGHIFSYTHTDIIARYKRMQGLNVFYPMGFDDNGLPTERYVEKKNATKAHLMKRSDFIALCLKESADVEKTFEQLWRSIGLSVDWDKIYSTISDRARRVSQQSFIDLHKKGSVYRKLEPALYCTSCQTSVAQAELDSAQVSTTFNDIQFTTVDGEHFTVATTRPELLPACVAVFYHPDDIRYKKFAGKNAVTPIFNKQVPMLPDDQVDPEKGTGLVMCCTFGDQTDIAWYKKYRLPYVHIVGFDGRWTAEAGALAGLKVHEARKKVLELLKEGGTLLAQKAIAHNVSTHERCKQEIEYLVLSQWFINILDHKEDFLAMAEKINWYPGYMKARYVDWVKHLNWDWGISRQRFFGVPFPVWHCMDCKHEIVADQALLPVDPQETNYPGGKCPHCSSINIKADTDVMDTWNTSSLTPQINAHWPEGTNDFTMPMSMRPQAHDIIRTWAFDTIVKSFYHHGDIPWDNIVISGHVLAGKEKISKSQGNEKMKPETLLSDYSADAVRYWTACGKLGTDTAFSENQLKIGQKLVTKLWNAFKFFGSSIGEITKRPELKPTDNLNKWLLDGLTKTMKEYQEQFELYEYSNALEVVEKFFWATFCDNYLEMVKDRFFNPADYDPVLLASTKEVLYEVGLALIKMYAPFVPYITEFLYQEYYLKVEKTVSIHQVLLDGPRHVHSFEQSLAIIAASCAVIDQVRKLKSEHHVSLKTPLKTLTICSANEELLVQLGQEKQLIAGITKSDEIIWKGESLSQPMMEQVDTLYHARVGV